MSQYPLPSDPWSRSILGSRHFYLALVISVLALLLLLFGVKRTLGGVHESSDHTPNSELTDIEFIPETERPLEFCVLGIDPVQASHYDLPDLKKNHAMPAASWKELLEQVYWLDLELSHGRILQALPSKTELYVAVPDPKTVQEATGKEPELFRGYLSKHCHWSKVEIEKRVHFFKCPAPMIWAQDIGKILGKDRDGRWVLFRSATDLYTYYEDVAALCKAFPQKFTCRELPHGVSAEGGDEDLVRDPNGRLVLLIGRHRVVRYLQWKNGFALNAVGASPAFGQALEDPQIKAVLDAYEGAFSPLALALMPERVLGDPDHGNDELFHLDMGVGVAGPFGKATAFVPTYRPHPINRQDGQALDDNFVQSLQAELDAIASEMKSMDFPVVRVPFADHPVRSPANFIRFFDPDKGKCQVLLSKYPRLPEGAFEDCSQGVLLKFLSQLRSDVEIWEKSPLEVNFRKAMGSASHVWDQMDTIAAESNPLFESVKADFEKAGVEVTSVPDFPWGAGGLHCEVLH